MYDHVFIFLVFVFFFFKQKTAYEMRISDWSSDVCSSDLPVRFGRIRCLFLSLLAPASLDMPRHDYSRCSMWVRSMSIIADMSFSSLVFILMSPTGTP